MIQKSEEAYLEYLASERESKLIAEKIEILMIKFRGARGSEKKFLKAEANSLFNEQMQVQQKGFRALKIFTKSDTVELPYNEFFADVVAVLHTEKPNSISSAIKFSIRNQVASDKALTKFGNNSRDFRNNIQRPKDLEGHHFFSAARAYLWTSYLASPSIMKNKKSETISAVFMAVAKEINRQLMNDSSTILDWKDANESLMSSIETEMRLRGIEPLK